MNFKLTERAVKEIKHIMKDQEMAEDATYVRAGVRGGGCSGYQYSFNLDEMYNEAKDTLIEQDGLKVVVDNRSALYLDGATVDFVEDLNARGFKFSNPNSRTTCGCGSSFSV